jgi:hypothetical protein
LGRMNASLAHEVIYWAFFRFVMIKILRIPKLGFLSGQSFEVGL